MRSSLNAGNLLCAAILLFLFRTSCASTTSTRRSGVLNEKVSKVLGVVRRALDSPTVDIYSLRRRSSLDREQFTLQIRTNEKASPKTQIKAETRGIGAATRSSNRHVQTRKNLAQKQSALQQQELIPQAPTKRPRLDRSNDGEWKRGGSKTSKSSGGVQPNIATGRKPDERAKSPINLAQHIRDSGHLQAGDIVEGSTKKSHLVPGAQFHTQAAHELYQTSLSRLPPVIEKHSDAHATLTIRPKIEPPETKSQSLSAKDHRSMHQTSAVPVDQRQNLDATRLNPTSLGQASAPLSSPRGNRSGSQDMVIGSDGAHSFESFEAVSAWPHSRDGPGRFPRSVPNAEQLNRLVDATQPRVQEGGFKVPPARFPDSVPQAEKLNGLLDAGLADRSQYMWDHPH